MDQLEEEEQTSSESEEEPVAKPEPVTAEPAKPATTEPVSAPATSEPVTAPMTAEPVSAPTEPELQLIRQENLVAAEEQLDDRCECSKFSCEQGIQDKATFKKWALQNHPDKGGNTEIFQKGVECNQKK